MHYVRFDKRYDSSLTNLWISVKEPREAFNRSLNRAGLGAMSLLPLPTRRRPWSNTTTIFYRSMRSAGLRYLMIKRYYHFAKHEIDIIATTAGGLVMLIFLKVCQRYPRRYNTTTSVSLWFLTRPTRPDRSPLRVWIPPTRRLRENWRNKNERRRFRIEE